MDFDMQQAYQSHYSYGHMELSHGQYGHFASEPVMKFVFFANMMIAICFDKHLSLKNLQMNLATKSLPLDYGIMSVLSHDYVC